jgi:anti-anti-sigma regulatory factor
MVVAVFVPPSRIDATNVAAFAHTVSECIARDGCMVIDCSEVEWIETAAMRVLEVASDNAPITLVNPNPAVHLVAVAFGGDIRLRYDRSSPPAIEFDVPGRALVSVHIGGKVAS